MAERVYIFDTTLRDGEQSPGCSMTVREKVAMARKLGDLGVDIIEAGFPIASDGDFEAVRAIARECRGPRVAALARAAAGDIERAARALEHARGPRIHTFIATSEIHLKYKLKKTRAQVLCDTVAAVELARRHVDDVEFSAEDATRTDPAYLEEVACAAAAAGARTINIPDTVGYATPDEFSALVARIARAVGDRAVVSVHCHNDLGLAVANSLAAVQAGARQVECTVNGIGERAGNCSLEEIVMILRVRADRLPYMTGIVTPEIFPASQRLTETISCGPQPNKAIVGRNAFAHEAGIHQDGILKERTTYEIMDPKMVGVPESRLVLGKHSGRHALKKRCEDLGYALTRDEIETVYQLFTGLADRKKGVMDEEIVRIIQLEIARRPVPAGDRGAVPDQPWI
jgi:2-isopropylmalate synthase